MSEYMTKRSSLLIQSVVDKCEFSILEHDGVAATGITLAKFNIDTLKRMGRIEAARWVGEPILFFLSATQERFYDSDTDNYPTLPPEPDTNALEQLRIAMSFIVRAIELDSSFPLDEAKQHLLQAKAGGLSLAEELIDTLLPKLKNSLRTDFS